ncbi:MAG TPA: pilus assembly protein PilM [Vicinamibacterales bacterium]
MSLIPSLLVSPPPSVGVEIAADRVTAVSLERQSGGWIVAGYAVERLPAGVVTPAMNGVNVHDASIAAAAMRSAFDKIGSGRRRVALVIPDTAAKLSLLRFEKVPAASDLDQLVRWQMRKAAPFKPEDAQVSWVPASELPGGGREFLVTMARRDIVESYMAVCADAGADAGVVDLATLNLINAALAARTAASADRPASRAASKDDALIVNVAADYATLAILRGDDLIFFRTRASTIPARSGPAAATQLDGDADLADLVHQTAMYYEDRLGGRRFARVVLTGGSGRDTGERLRRALEERIGVAVEPLDFRASASMRDRISAGPELLDMLAPAVGIVLRERAA